MKYKIIFNFIFIIKIYIFFMISFNFPNKEIKNIIFQFYFPISKINIIKIEIKKNKKNEKDADKEIMKPKKLK
jgi:hypothetical protein